VSEQENGQRVLVSGSAGFIGGYIVEELLGRGYEVVGIDDYSKYGPVTKSYDDHPRYRFVEGDARDVELMTELLSDCDHFIAGAALIGGISYFHAYAYDLLATNERIMASSCDAAIRAHRTGRLTKMTYMSSSMVFESTDSWPSVEGSQRQIPPPLSSYGFQKLAVEYYAQAAWDQYQLPFTICRPFNCVGIGEGRALGEAEVLSGNVKLAMSHVVPDLVQKVLKGQDPLHVLGTGEQVRHYTYGGDLARGIVTAMEHPAALNEDFNLSTPHGHTVVELAEVIWRKLKGADVPLRLEHDPAYEHDVQRRVPSTDKARDVLGFEATTSLDDMLDEVIPWIERAVADGTL
jgi:nucleoside-diphosphate-sugar epimerase